MPEKIIGISIFLTLEGSILSKIKQNVKSSQKKSKIDLKIKKIGTIELTPELSKKIDDTIKKHNNKDETVLKETVEIRNSYDRSPITPEFYTGKTNDQQVFLDEELFELEKPLELYYKNDSLYLSNDKTFSFFFKKNTNKKTKKKSIPKTKNKKQKAKTKNKNVKSNKKSKKTNTTKTKKELKKTKSKLSQKKKGIKKLEKKTKGRKLKKKKREKKPKKIKKPKKNKLEKKNKPKKKVKKRIGIRLPNKKQKDKEPKKSKKKEKGFFKTKKKEKNVPDNKKTQDVTSTDTTDFDEEIGEALEIIDNLLGELPEEKIDEFVQSDDFKVYERVVEKYKKK